MTEQAIEQSWKDIGCSVRPLGRKIFCRTLPRVSTTVGGIVIPGGSLSFYSGPPHLQILEALVLSVGPRVKGIVKGDIINFKRFHFARIWDLPDGTKGGWIDMGQVLGSSKTSIGSQQY
jgi:hypothetical protein